MPAGSTFSDATAAWFAATFPDGATPAQAAAWPAIASGAHVLVCAPTGSGKTLAAFLHGLDHLATTAPERPGVRLLYVSPLKALNYDVERNLRGPLAGIRATADRLNLPVSLPSVAVRTGDTPAAERAAMLRRPPEILITTPESLFLLLTSPNARDVLRQVGAVIIDEVHAVAGTKRGSHLALSLERLDHLVGRDVQRIALSATQRPLEEIARFVGGDRPVTIVDTGVRKELDLEVVVALDDMTELPESPEGGATIWPSVYPRILELVLRHTTTLVFVNYRRLAERLALRLNELAGFEVARAHHGSLARELRTTIEESLKRGELRCLVATSSLELGIDMGAIDLVIQVESPGSVARGLQRVGRSGHQVGAPSTGRVFPKHRGDLLEAAVVTRRMIEGAIEETRVPRNPLDVLAQHVVAAAANDEWPVEALARLVRRSYPFAELPDEQLDGVLDMLSGRYPSDDFAELRPRIVWDRIEGTIRGRENARALAVANAGTIPDRGLYGVFLADGSGRVGELDEEMVYEARAGQVFTLGASAWRIEQITRDRVLVSPAPGQSGQVPFWRGEAPGRPVELGRAIGAFTRELAALTEPDAIAQLTREHRLDARAAGNLVAYLRDQRAATRALPTDRTIVVERFRDEIGDWRMVVLSPFGGRVHAPWALALGALVRGRFGADAQAMWTDDGIVLHLPDADDPPPADIVAVAPEAIEDLVLAELASSALYGARFRENAARALLIPRRRPGQRTPLWQQRLKAQSLLAATEGYGSFPIVLETYRECLQDVFDLPSLVGLLTGIERREITIVDVETPYGSPFASSLLFDFVARYMYEGDTPPAERRAQALALDRGLLRQLLGSDELRDLLDADAVAGVETALRARHGASVDSLHDLLRRSGERTTLELADDAGVAELVRTRRAAVVRIAGTERVIAAEDAGRYRDGVGALPPPGLPDAFTEPVEHALRSLVNRHARTSGPFAAQDLADRLGVPVQRVLDELASLERDGRVVHGALRPGCTGTDWCDVDVLRRIRRASVATLRAEVEAVSQPTLARFAARWHGVDDGGRGDPDRLREAIARLQGVPLLATVAEEGILARRVPGYNPSLLDGLCAAGEVVWCGAGEGRVALYLRADAPLVGPPGAVGNPDGPVAMAILARLEQGDAFFNDLTDAVGAPAGDVGVALWSLVWGSLVTGDAFAPVRARRVTPRASNPPGVRPGARRLGRRPTAVTPAFAGRWRLAAPLFAGASQADRAAARVELLLERHGVVTRAAARGEGVTGGFAALYGDLAAMETLGTARRGYFVEGLGGAQFALPGAVERLRDLRERPDSAEVLVLAASDPAQLYGAALAWPSVAGGRAARSAGAHVVLVDGEAVLYVERGGRSITSLLPPKDARIEQALNALAASLAILGRLAVERADGAPVAGSEWESRLLQAGFRRGPRRLTLG